MLSGQIQHLAKTRTPLATLLILVFAIHGCGDSGHKGDFYEESQRQGYANLTVLYVPSEGFAYEDEMGELTGVTIDIMHEFADFVEAAKGIEVRYNFVPEDNWQHFYSMVKNSNGGVFGLGNVTITEARKQELRFSPPYMTNIAVLITHDSVPDIRELTQLEKVFAGKTGLAFEGTLHQDRVERLKENYIPDASIEFVNSNAEILERVASDDGLFSYIDIYQYWRAAERGKPLKQHQAADLASERFGIIMPLNNDWGPILTDFFEREMNFRTSRTYRSILEKHLGPELTEKLEQARDSVVGD